MLPSWPHMPGPRPAGVKNVKHAFTLCCEEKSLDILLSLEGQNDGVTTHVCHLAHAGGIVYVLFHVRRRLFTDV